MRCRCPCHQPAHVLIIRLSSFVDFIENGGFTCRSRCAGVLADMCVSVAIKLIKTSDAVHSTHGCVYREWHHRFPWVRLQRMCVSTITHMQCERPLRGVMTVILFVCLSAPWPNGQSSRTGWVRCWCVVCVLKLFIKVAKLCTNKIIQFLTGGAG